MVSKRNIEVDPNKIKAIVEMKPPRKKFPQYRMNNAKKPLRRLKII